MHGIQRKMRRVSRKGEESDAQAMGGRRQPASGAMEHSKGDVRTSRWLLERKDTSRKSYTLNESDLAKLAGQALDEDLLAVFKVVFMNGRSYAIIDWPLFTQMDAAFAPESPDAPSSQESKPATTVATESPTESGSPRKAGRPSPVSIR